MSLRGHVSFHLTGAVSPSFCLYANRLTMSWLTWEWCQPFHFPFRKKVSVFPNMLSSSFNYSVPQRIRTWLQQALYWQFKQNTADNLPKLEPFLNKMMILITYSLWSLIRSESESRAHPPVAAFSFHLAGRKILLPQAFVPTNYTCCYSPWQAEQKSILKLTMSSSWAFSCPLLPQRLQKALEIWLQSVFVLH